MSIEELDMAGNPIGDEEDEDIDETLGERLMGLTEMLPESVRNACGVASDFTVSASKVGYGFTRNLVWVLASAATIMALPVIMETERSQQHEMQREQERQLLLGPSSAMPGGQGQMMQNMMPAMPRPGA